MDYLPLGFTRSEGASQPKLSAVENKQHCPTCGEGYPLYSLSKQSGWEKPETAATSYCKECGQKFELALVPVE